MAPKAVCRGDKAAHQFAMFYLKENRLVAVEAINSAKGFHGRQAIVWP
jgi:fructoselysine-6-P-deglycase FrlB-like protein